jgi:hypothetical protein
MTKIRITPRLAVGCLLALLGLGIEGSQAADLKFRVQLIWGTNDRAKDPPIADKIAFDEDNAKASANNDKYNVEAKESQGAKDTAKGDQAPPKGASSTENRVKKASDDKTQKPPLKEVDAQLAERLRKVFKWKHYYEIFRKEPVTVGNAAEKVKLSQKCEIELRNIGKPMLEVKLFGEGKLVKTVKQGVTPDLVIGGDDPKNDSGWFIVISAFDAQKP